MTLSAFTRAGEYQYEGLPRYIAALEAWFYSELKAAYQSAVLPDGSWPLCLGVIVYGDYVDRFLKLCVRSLLAPGNVPALRNPLIIIHTDTAGLPVIEAGIDELREYARVEMRALPDELMAKVPENRSNIYWLLGAAGNLHMQMAKYRGHGYHMLMPDHIYATGYFANLQRIADSGVHAIVQGAMSAVLEDVAPLLIERDCVFSPTDLNALALDHLHQQAKPFLVNGRQALPGNVFLMYVGERAVQLVSPHASPVYLSHHLLMWAPLRNFNTIDAQLPYWIPCDTEFVVPAPEDGMTYIEVSNADRYYREAPGYTIDELCAHFWILCFCNKDFVRFFRRPTVLPLPAGYCPPYSPLPDVVIDAHLEDIYIAIDQSHAVFYEHLPEEAREDPIERFERRKLEILQEIAAAPAG